ncbi:G2/mitotic-specific cyclin-2 [Capsicum annuum]|nr:G2/mitotic-specific cyclin-2 [Capsicum annuum]
MFLLFDIDIIHRGTSKVISIATTNARDLRNTLPSLTDNDATRVIGKLIAERSKEADVYAIGYELRKNENKVNFVNKIPLVPIYRPITRKLAAQITNKQQKSAVEITKPLIPVAPIRNEIENCVIIDAEDYKATGYSDVLMFVQHTEAMMEEIDRWMRKLRWKMQKIGRAHIFLFIELCLVEYEMLRFPPSMFAVAAVFTAQCTLGMSREWNATCEKHSNYDKNQILEFSKLMGSFYQKATVGKLTGMHQKYSTSKYGNAIRCEPASFLSEAWF